MIKTTYALTEDNIDVVSDQIVQYCTDLKMDKKEILRCRLSAEEVILNWMEKEIDDKFTFICGKRFNRPYMSLEITGHPCNPFEEHEEESAFLNSIQAQMGVSPQYSYKKGVNQIYYEMPRKAQNQLVLLIKTIVLALVIGVLSNMFLPEQIRTFLLEGYVNLLYDTAFRILGCVSGPLIMLSVMWGIYGIGDAGTLERVGKSMILRAIVILCIIAVLVTLTFPLYHLSMTDGSTAQSSIQIVFKMLLDIVPEDIISPLQTGNSLQIIMLAVVLGIAMLFLGKKVRVVVDLIEQINCLVQFLMNIISKMIFAFIFLIIIRMAWSNDFVLLASAWKLFVFYLIGMLLACAIMTLITAIRQKVSPFVLFYKSIPTLLITLTTASSSAAFATDMETCEKRFGIDHSFTSFGIPLGIVIFKSCTVVYDLTLCFFFAEQFSVSCSVSWLVTACFTTIMLTLAAPPIPGGAAVIYMVMFQQLGIPEEALSIILSIDILFDFFVTTGNVYNLSLLLINTAGQLNKLDRNILRSRENLRLFGKSRPK